MSSRHLLCWGGLWAAAVAAAVVLGVATAAAETPRISDAQTKAQPAAPERAIITADRLAYDNELRTVTARGTVVVRYKGRVLTADTVHYSQSTDAMSASGNVVITSLDDSVLSAEHLEISGDLKEGFASAAKLVLKDGAWATARIVRGINDDRTELEDAAFSACRLCTADANKPPLWRIKAKKITHDRKNRRITYRDAWLEALGVPVLYTPYFEHPDPTLKRASGLLAPKYRSSRTAGLTLVMPYYWVIDDHQDVTLSPLLSTKKTVGAIGQYRGFFEGARIVADGSALREMHGHPRSHLFLNARFPFDEMWRAGVDLNVASDRKYLHDYGFDTTPEFLSSRIWLEGFGRRSYAAVNGYSFQDLSGVSKSTFDQAVIAPLAEWSLVTAPNRIGAYHALSFSASAINRENSQPQYRRLRADYAWSAPYIDQLGNAYKFEVGARANVDHALDIPDEEFHRRSDETAGLRPYAAATWSLPLERQHTAWHDVIEPVAQVVVSPRVRDKPLIADEDHTLFELNDANLFLANRFEDQHQGGSRLNYGLKYNAAGTVPQRVGLTIGQSYGIGQQGDDAVSDVVGRAMVGFKPNLDLTYRFALDHKTLDARRTEVSAAFGPPISRFDVGYLELKQPDGASKHDRREAFIRARSAISPYWSLQASVQRDPFEADGPASLGLGAAYEDECLVFSITGAREYDSYGDDPNNDRSPYSIALQVRLKYGSEVL